MKNKKNDYRFHAVTDSLCPKCNTPVPAEIIIKPAGHNPDRESVFLLKQCDLHGEFECLVEEDAQWYLNRLNYDRAGTASQTQTTIRQGCPFDCGLCPDHKQHTCIGLIEVTDNCDLGCPRCYARSGADKGFKDLRQIETMMDFYREAEGGKAEILQISGGEPSSHPDIIKIIESARRKGFKYVMLNTNGLRMATDTAFVKQLSRFETGFEIYLQFDGFEKATSMRLRGRDLRGIKQDALDNLVTHGVAVTLVPTIEKGLNDDEIGRIVDYAMETPCIRGINFQPTAYFGRGPRDCPADRMTISGILRRIEEQTAGRIAVDDFVPLPCNVHSVAVTYLFREKKEFVPISRRLDISSYLPLINNTFYLDATELADEAKQCKMCDCLPFLKGLRKFLPASYMIKSQKEQKTFIDRNTFRISVSMFQDAYNFDKAGIQKECIHIITEDLKRIPFSAYNIFHRGKRTEAGEKTPGTHTGHTGQ